MTLHATRNGQQVTVHSTYGTSEHKITEHAQHVRGFHTQLGQLLDAADVEREREAAAAHREHGHHEAHEHG